MTTNAVPAITQPNYFRTAANVGSGDIPLHRIVARDGAWPGAKLATSPADSFLGLSVEVMTVDGPARSVQVAGCGIAETGGAFARGARLTSDSQGRVVEATDEQSVIGVAEVASTGAGEFVTLELEQRANSRGNVQKHEVTVGHADLTAAALTQTLNLGAALPANAFVLGVESELTTPFTGGGVSAINVDVGYSGNGDALIDGRDLFTGAAALLSGNGDRPSGSYDETQLTALFTATSANVVAATAGSVTFRVLYVVLDV